MKRHLRGFTLIELMVTIAVLGILAALAFPGMSDYFDKQRLISQTRAIADLAQLARSEAIKHSASTNPKTVSMTINATAPWYVGLANSGTIACTGAAGATPCVTNEAGSNISHIVTATECTGCTVTSPTTQTVIVFDLRGLATIYNAGIASNTSQPITLRSPRGKQLSLTVGRLGRISLCSPSGTVSGYTPC